MMGAGMTLFTRHVFVELCRSRRTSLFSMSAGDLASQSPITGIFGRAPAGAGAAAAGAAASAAASAAAAAARSSSLSQCCSR